MEIVVIIIQLAGIGIFLYGVAQIFLPLSFIFGGLSLLLVSHRVWEMYEERKEMEKSIKQEGRLDTDGFI